MQNQIVIIGYSGHSYCCIEVAINQGFLIVGYHDVLEKASNPFNLKFLGHEAKIDSNDRPFITIGNNNIRRKVYEKLMSNNILLQTILMHSNTIISKSSSIGKQTFINAGVIINPQVKIDVGCIINTGAIVEHDCNIGQFSHIAPGAILCGNVSIGDNTLIGANSTILPNITIGDNVTVGAGSVVTNNIPSNSIYVGNPAKPIHL